MQEFKAKAKTTQKMTRDGVVETDQTTGEQTRTSSRETDDFSGDAAKGATPKKPLTAPPKGSTARQRNGVKGQKKKQSRQRKQWGNRLPACNSLMKNAPTRSFQSM